MFYSPLSLGNPLALHTDANPIASLSFVRSFVRWPACSGPDCNGSAKPAFSTPNRAPNRLPARAGKSLTVIVLKLIQRRRASLAAAAAAAARRHPHRHTASGPDKCAWRGSHIKALVQRSSTISLFFKFLTETRVSTTRQTLTNFGLSALANRRRPDSSYLGTVQR